MRLYVARSCCRFPSAARAREQSSTTRRARRLGHRDAQPQDSPCLVGFCYVLCTPANRTANSPTQERHAFKHAKSTDLAKAKGETGGERQALHQTPGKPKGKDERRRANQKEKTMQRLGCTNENTGARKHMDTVEISPGKGPSGHLEAVLGQGRLEPNG